MMPKTEQAAFEEWLDRVRPEGTCEQVQAQWAISSAREEWEAEQLSPKPRREFLELAESCGAYLTGKPDGSEPITIVFPIKAWREFDAATVAQSAPDEREAFEAAVVKVALANGYSYMGELLKRDAEGSYRQSWVDSSWLVHQAWQRAQSAPAGAVREPIFFVDPDYVRLLDGRTKITATLYANSASGGAMPVYAAPQPAPREWPVVHTSVGCIACEGSPAGDNNPCHICGATQPAAQQEQGDEVRRLREALETERQRLAACGVAALGYFDGCADEYKSASLSDVLSLRTKYTELLSWAVGRWEAEVKNRPLANVHRRSLDDTWRQVIRQLGGDPVVLCGPDHDTLSTSAEGKA